jgi:hypothetical protein
MGKSSKLRTKREGLKHRDLAGSLDVRHRDLGGSFDVKSSATATAFRTAAKAYTERATQTKESAVETLHREGFLTKGGKFAKAYAAKG